jgi:hypothetical protein
MLLVVVLGLVFASVESNPALALGPTQPVVGPASPNMGVQGTVSQLDTSRGRMSVQTAKGTIELSDRVTLQLPNGTLVPESLKSPRVLKVGVVIIIIRNPNGSVIVIVIRA